MSETHRSTQELISDLTKPSKKYTFSDRYYTTVKGRTPGACRHEYIRLNELRVRAPRPPFRASESVLSRSTARTMDDPRPFQLASTMRGTMINSRYIVLGREFCVTDGYISGLGKPTDSI